MIGALSKYIAICFMLLCITIVISCQKIPGHTINSSSGVTGTTASTGSTGSTGSKGSTGSTGSAGGSSTIVGGGGTSPIAVGATNTVIFRVNNDTTYTWTAADYNIQIVTVSPPLNLTHPIVGAKSGIGGLNDFEILYYSLTSGVYNGEVKISLDLLSGNKYLDGIEKITTTTEILGSPQTLKGTFDGYCHINSSAADSVRVYGSFNLQQ